MEIEIVLQSRILCSHFKLGEKDVYLLINPVTNNTKVEGRNFNISDEIHIL